MQALSSLRCVSRHGVRVHSPARRPARWVISGRPVAFQPGHHEDPEHPSLRRPGAPTDFPTLHSRAAAKGGATLLPDFVLPGGEGAASHTAAGGGGATAMMAGGGMLRLDLPAHAAAQAAAQGAAQAAADAEAVLAAGRRKALEMAAYVSMARLNNLGPSIALVLLGAWVGSLGSWAALHSGGVWAAAAMSAGVTTGSMVVNDFFDWDSGVDRVNAPNKPLPSGLVLPHSALLLASSLYIVTLIAACLMEPPMVRVIVALSAGATMLYTPLLKRLPLMKTATVAATVAAAPAMGAFAAHAGAAGLLAVAAPCAYIFLAIAYQEIMMDISDVSGDSAAGVWTLPARAGRRLALAAACALYAAGLAVVVAGVAFGQRAAWLLASHTALQPLVRGGLLAAVAVFNAPLAAGAAHIWHARDFSKDTTNEQVTLMRRALGVGLFALALCA